MRKNLLNSGAARRYLLYALGEIALVVIGILIALQVNNWNNNRIAKNTRLEYKENLVIELEADVEKLKELLSFNNTYEQMGFDLLHFLEGKAIDADTSLLMEALVYSQYCPSFRKVISTYTELINGGSMKLFGSFHLKRLLNDYYTPNEWTITFYERIRKTMWYDYRDELVSCINPLIFGPIYMRDQGGGFPASQESLLQYVHKLDNYKIDWEILKQNEQLKQHLRQIQSHRVQIKNGFYNDLNAANKLIAELKSME